MEEKEILQRQVDALEKLLQIKDAIIHEQEAKINKLENEALVNSFPQFPSVQTPYLPPAGQQINIPSMWPADQCPSSTSGYHDYPHPWGGTVPPSCRKCGKQASTWAITYADGTVGHIK
jgi:hypothetical protein